ncbi:hypothetical protein ACTWQL_12645 [Pseudalkalibacillus sp. R45]|uniref:hypothetical protein n=1 Tax=Pseudalkalibacillus sp. R45 TaxID=3457433 RepID=UPI003FCD1E2A
MKRISFYFIMMLFVLLSSVPTYATSWVELSPEQVEKDADIIVLGTYDFSGLPIKGKMIFGGYDFNVQKVFKGDAEEIITAGIDAFDKGWVEEFQQEGGGFLLFLEKNEGFRFPTPVGGPNGMIQVKNGNVVNEKVYKKNFYEQLMMTGSTAPSQNTDGPAKSFFQSAWPIISVVGLGLLVFLIVKNRRGKA